jgi:hypothetical protein
MKSLNSSPDPTYSSVNLSIYAISEVFVGVFTACLPPLRKTFDQVLRKILPAGLLSSRASKSRESCALKPLSDHSDTIKRSKAGHTSDGDSERSMLEGNELKGKKSHDEILKTTQLIVTIDDKESERGRDGSWA